MRSKQKGFTLIELLVVIAIIGILVTIVIVAINPIKVINSARDGRARTDLNQVKASLQLYYNENTRYPTTDEEKASGCTSGGNTVCFTPTYMKSVPSETITYLPTTDANGICDNISNLCTTYTASVPIKYISNDDNNAGSKCVGTTFLPYTVGSDGSYWVCPD
jgi:prepilin-type N-terminal cleavage/methylation domain-containing protein